MSEEKNKILTNLRKHLENDYGSTFCEGHTTYFFTTPFFNGDEKKQIECYMLDSAYAAVAAPETVVRFRAYVQLQEYKVKYIEKFGGRYIFNLAESAYWWAKKDLETLCKKWDEQNKV